MRTDDRTGRTSTIGILSSLYDNALTCGWADVMREPETVARDRPWGLGWRAWGRALARSVRGASVDDYGIVASSIAFAAFLSLLPLMSIVALTYGMVVPHLVVASNIQTLVQVLPAGPRHFVRSWLTKSLVRQHADGLALVLSILLTLFSARRAGRSLLHGINVASGIGQDRGPIARQLVSMAVVLACATLFLSALASISALALIRRLVPDGLPDATVLFNLLMWSALTLGPAIALLLIYRYAAARRAVPWWWALPGAAMAVLGWLGATRLFRLYVGHFADYGSTYGSLSAVIVLLLLLMLSAYILLFGAKLNAEAIRAAAVGRE